MAETNTRIFMAEFSGRSIDEAARTATFVAATENGVDTWGGREYLRISGVRLDRYRRNPVVLDSHNRYAAGAVVGKAEVKVSGRELQTTITFASTAAAEQIWSLVKDGFLRALSVGFLPSEVQILKAGESANLSGRQIQGPARLVNSWELYEISIVPVPVDADALQRVLSERAQAKPAAPADEGVRVRSIRALAPKGLEPIAERCIIEGKSLEEARKILLVEHLRRPLHAGGTSETKPAKVIELADVPDDVLVRSLCGEW